MSPASEEFVTRWSRNMAKGISEPWHLDVIESQFARGMTAQGRRALACKESGRIGPTARALYGNDWPDVEIEAEAFFAVADCAQKVLSLYDRASAKRLGALMPED